jgi:excinuclease ABC subunit C
MTPISEHIQGILKTLPTKPGCYIMRNADGKIIYVGKAINLRNRVRSYFHSSADQTMKTRRLVSEWQTSNGSWWLPSWKRSSWR